MELYFLLLGLLKLTWISKAYLLASGMNHGPIAIHNSNLSNYKLLEGHSDNIFALKYIGKNYLASASKDKTVRIWNITNYACLYELKHTDEVFTLEYLGNGLLASGSKEKAAFIWNVMTGERKKKLVHNEEVRTLLKVNDDLLAGGGKKIYLWKISSGVLVSSFSGHNAYIIAMIRINNETIASIGFEEDYVKIWSVLLQKFKEISVESTLSMISINTNYLAIGSKENFFVLWNVTSNQIDKKITTLTDVKFILSIQNGTSVICRKDNNIAQIWNISTSAESSFQSGDIRVVVELPNGDLVTGNSGKKLINWRWDNITFTFKNSEQISLQEDVHKLELIQERDEPEPNIIITQNNEAVNLDSFSEEDINNLLQADANIISCLLNCSNHGQCILTDSGQFSCNCTQNFTGFACEIDKRKCLTKPCINNGTCYDVITSQNYDFYCECSHNNYGKHCEFEINVCQNETCSNHGTCKERLNLPECDCFYLYSGKKCETEKYTKKLIDMVTSFSSILAIVILVSFYALIVSNDVANFFGKCKKTTLKKKKLKIQKFAYKNF